MHPRLHMILDRPLEDTGKIGWKAPGTEYISSGLVETHWIAVDFVEPGDSTFVLLDPFVWNNSVNRRYEVDAVHAPGGYM